ncbi:MAG: phosphate acyltransferase PlsX [Lachnospiraceae bacterium]|nr:phosphate acyltransferase PlsX [Lachnospiraceae bacterium]
MVRVALDAMGGDNAPQEIVKGALMALEKSRNLKVFLVGIPEKIEPFLGDASRFGDRLTVVPASEVITTEETPVMAVRRKKDSSIVVGQRLVRAGDADAFVSAGSTGAVLVGGMVHVGRIRGVERAPLGTLIPSERGPVLLIDAGANVDVKPENLLQFARMGSVYMSLSCGIGHPRVALANIGVEEEKGNALVKAASPLLAAQEDLNYTGYVESREIPAGGADVVVCDGFAGNLMLKMYEGAGGTLLAVLKKTLKSSLKNKIGAALIQKDLRAAMKTFDSSEYGGAPMLGLAGLVVKAHGSSKAKEICNSLLQCKTFQEQHIGEAITKLFSAEEPGEENEHGIGKTEGNHRG